MHDDLPASVVVIGGSAGAWHPLRAILKNLASDLDAAVVIVIHRWPHAATGITSVMEGETPWVVREPTHAEPLRRGHAYLAPPDQHLRIDRERIIPTREPREHHARPAVDVLFRSAAREFGTSVIGVLLSGTGSDGSAGLLAIRARGGTVVIQTPEDADERDMPERAIAITPPDYLLPASEIGPLLPGLLTNRRSAAAMPQGSQDVTQAAIEREIDAQQRGGQSGQLTPFTCPDCGGTLWQGAAGAAAEYACHIGHRWSSDGLLVHKSEQLEAALLESVRLLREKAMLLRQLAAKSEADRFGANRERLLEQALVVDGHASQLQSQLIEHQPATTGGRATMGRSASRSAPHSE
jgi:two-component system chemotaxis response regulator CheB